MSLFYRFASSIPIHRTEEIKPRINTAKWFCLERERSRDMDVSLLSFVNMVMSSYGSKVSVQSSLCVYGQKADEGE